MKAILALAVLSLALTASAVEAATLTYRGFGNGVYGIYLRGGSTIFDGISLSVTPRPVTPAPAPFLNLNSGLQAGAPRPAGHAFTYRNRALDLAPDDIDNPGIGKGWTILAAVTSTTLVSFAGGPLGQQISTAGEPNGELFLANVMLSHPWEFATAVLTLGNGVDTVFTGTFVIPDIPEPATIGMGVMSLFGLVVFRRRK